METTIKKLRLRAQNMGHEPVFGGRTLVYLVNLLTIIAVLLLAACASPPGETNAELGQEFSLILDQSASIVGEPLKIRFLEIINDSRCPKGVNCAWEGEVTCLVEITYFESLYRKVLTQPGLIEEPANADFKEYEIAFDVQPYPEAGRQIAKKDYRLQMVINKKPALSGGILVTFEVIDERYSVFITNQKAIEQVYAVQKGESQATIPSGRIVRGSVPYNQPWSWHIDSEDIGMAEFTIELCDGKPSHVEADLDYWVETVGFFCPLECQDS
jgi:hypothetical protein